MNTLTISLLILLLGNSCKKTLTNNAPETSASTPLIYQIFDTDGNNILTPQINTKDSVMLSCNNGVFYDQLEEPVDSLTNALLISKYNGVIISDNHIARYNNSGGTGANMLNSFKISYHGRNLGVIDFQLKQQHALWVEASVFTLNNATAKLDSSTGIHIYKLQYNNN